jgi:hypothetical protein
MLKNIYKNIKYSASNKVLNGNICHFKKISGIQRSIKVGAHTEEKDASKLS